METALQDAAPFAPRIRGLATCGRNRFECSMDLRHRHCDLPLIYDTWRNNFRRDSLPWSRVSVHVWEPAFTRCIDRLLANSRTVVAVTPDDDDEIMGYLVYQPDALVWAFVKPPYRREGIFWSLLRASGLPMDLAGCEAVCCTLRWFAKPDGLETKFKAQHNPFRMFQ